MSLILISRIICYSLQVAVCLRVLCFGMVFLFNAVMWTMFAKSLQKCSSVVATVTNTASNFFFTVSWTVAPEVNNVVIVAVLLTVCKLFSRIEVENRHFRLPYSDCIPPAEKLQFQRNLYITEKYF